MTREKINQMMRCAYLLPAPGCEVVRECLQEITRLRDLVDAIDRECSLCKPYQSLPDRVQGLIINAKSDGIDVGDSVKSLVETDREKTDG